MTTENKLDDLTFSSLLSVLQGGMWLLNDIESFLRNYDLSHGRFSILLAIMESSDESNLSKNIAHRLGKSKVTISKMIKKLEEDLLIECINDPLDGRAKKINLSKKGDDLLSVLIPIYNNRIIEMTKNLTSEDKEQLMNIISKIDFLDKSKKIKVKK